MSSNTADEQTTVALKEAQPDIMTGRRVGPYEIVREIGQGGMGAVYLGARADDEFRKQVAIKLVRLGMESDFVLRRFRQERQILAGLDHPNIARLLDGGSTPEGLPYFVMEYVEGQPIAEYCDSHRLTTNERLNIFREVCSAIQYAHQNLIVHRDIKPGNILVCPDGRPKLLDFGIARLLAPSGLAGQPGELTAQIMTPEYASPEQIRGEPITTATDVYSLGVLLYELLAGHRPYRITGQSPLDIIRAVCEQEPEKPSTAVCRVETAGGEGGPTRISLTPEAISKARDSQPHKLRRQLEGDLDNIVLKAMRKEPQRRYASVEQLSEDIRRYLQGRPVTARKDTVTYRATKFIRRHRWAVAATALVALLLIAAAAVTNWQAVIARRERARAERRFNDVRGLANSFIFEVHDSIRDLAGSTQARQIVVNRALQYLDSLAQESSGDASLQAELAGAYRKIGAIQGNPFQGNLGDVRGALVSYGRAISILEPLVAVEPDNIQYRRELATACIERGQIYTSAIDYQRAIDDYKRARELVEPAAETNQSDTESGRLLWSCYYQLGYALALAGDLNAGHEHFLKALDLSRRQLAMDPAARTQGDVASSYTALGQVAGERADWPAALENLRKGLAIDQEIARADPANAEKQVRVAIGYLNLGDLGQYSGDRRAALENYGKALAMLQSLEALDPRNARAKYNVAVAYQSVGEALMRTDQPGAIESFRKAARILDELAKADPADVPSRTVLAQVLRRLAPLLSATGNFDEAMKTAERSVSIAEEQRSRLPESAEVAVLLAGSYDGLGKVRVSAAERTRDTARRETELGEARALFQKALDLWAEVRASGRFVTVTAGSADEVEQDVKRVDAAIARLKSK